MLASFKRNTAAKNDRALFTGPNIVHNEPREPLPKTTRNSIRSGRNQGFEELHPKCFAIVFGRTTVVTSVDCESDAVTFRILFHIVILFSVIPEIQASLKQWNCPSSRNRRHITIIQPRARLAVFITIRLRRTMAPM